MPMTEVDFNLRANPHRHPYSPNGEGHTLNPAGCWWCGQPRAAHRSEVVYAHDETGCAVPEVRPVAEGGEGGQGG